MSYSPTEAFGNRDPADGLSDCRITA